MFIRILFLSLLFTAFFPPPLFAKKPVEYKAEVAVVFNKNCEKLLLDNIKKARKSIYTAVYTFAKKSFADELIDRAEKGVEIQLKIDKEQAKFPYTVTLIRKMKKAGIKITLISMPDLEAHMHHKFAVIDQKTVLSGSFNWTKKASEQNRENLVLIESEDIAKEFMKEWERI